MKRKLINVILAATMCVSLLAGCGNAGSNRNNDSNDMRDDSSTESGEEDSQESEDENAADGFVHDSNLNPPAELTDGSDPICKETVSLTIGVPQMANVEDWETNKQTLRVEELGNFDLTFKVYPAEEYATQVNLAVTAGGSDLPDILLEVGGDSLVATWGQAGAIIPLNDYYEHSAWYLTEAKERLGEDYYPMITSPDGNMYYVPSYAQSSPNEYGAKMWLYGPWMEALNLETPTTPEELRAVLRAFVDSDPNGNGQKDEIGLIPRDKYALEWFEALMTPFQYLAFATPNNWWDVKDGTITAAYTTEGYRKGLQYIRSLFDEGLIDPLGFTNDSSQTQTLLAQEDTVIGMYVYFSMSALPASDVRRQEYVGIAPLLSEDGTQYTPFFKGVPTPGGVITSNCKDPEAAFRLLDYLCSEEMAIWNRWGEKDVDWVVPEEGTLNYYGQPATKQDILAWGVPQNAHWYQVGPKIRHYSILDGFAWDGDETNMNYKVMQLQLEYIDKHPEETVSKLIYTTEEQETVNPIASMLDSYVRESIANFCTNNDGMDIYDDAVWEQYLEQLDAIGLPEVLEIVQTVYDRMYK